MSHRDLNNDILLFGKTVNKTMNAIMIGQVATNSVAFLMVEYEARQKTV